MLGEFNYSDNNNSLKLGYDSENNKWYEWIDRLPFKRDVFPTIKNPGHELGNLSKELVNQFGFYNKCIITAGTTDGIASFLSTGASKIGESVTAIGTTMVIKSIIENPDWADFVVRDFEVHAKASEIQKNLKEKAA